jgi:hypothetical protein
MSTWILTVVSKSAITGLTALEVFETRLKEGFWGIPGTARKRDSLRRGDRIVLYVGFPQNAFPASAVLETDCYKLPPQEADARSHAGRLVRYEYGVRLSDIKRFPTPRPVNDLAPKLDFIKNKVRWGTAFQRTIIQISEKDFRTITHSI